MKIAIAEDLWMPVPKWLQLNHHVVYNQRLFEDQAALATAAQDAHALIVRNKTKVDAQLLKRLTKLQVVGRLGVGLDNIHLPTCRERGITVIAARGFNANSVVEYVMASMFHHARFLSRCDRLTKGGLWNRELATGREIGGKTLGLIGVGDIGQRVAMRAKAMGMHVLAYDPVLLRSHMLVQDFDVQLVNLKKLCEESDYVSIHVPLLPETRHLIGESELNAMKETTVIINTSRGGIVDEKALLDSLQQWPQRFAVLDVREVEPPAPNDAFRQLENVLLTPHIAGITHESSKRVSEFVLEEVDKKLRKLPFQGAVI
ncbi:hydroxyacid dehydrogenase [Alicyclobacillus tolerans]|uniref:hydroxyacid dehydrogenase n=1 Tax=Alicyclobacillus tolerans TaxID=90970 RepID=UPI001F43F10E|nr:hydroxyacid dehydrogenase [Alicyclobacillus tolerans]MCF8565308.1 hydroxyacid dehydrogenase [Alicyclobacillus tolerans]